MTPILLIPVVAQVLLHARCELSLDSIHERVVALINHCDLKDLYDTIELMEDSGVIRVTRDERRDVLFVSRGQM